MRHARSAAACRLQKRLQQYVIGLWLTSRARATTISLLAAVPHGRNGGEDDATGSARPRSSSWNAFGPGCSGITANGTSEAASRAASVGQGPPWPLSMLQSDYDHLLIIRSVARYLTRGFYLPACPFASTSGASLRISTSPKCPCGFDEAKRSRFSHSAISPRALAKAT